MPLFLAAATAISLPISNVTAALILPTNIIMGLYVHSGWEFFPRWWHKSWATKWFITATFHDQHHKYFNWNFGGYTTVWDRICGTNRARFEPTMTSCATAAPIGGARSRAGKQQPCRLRHLRVLRAAAR